jgi:hypothetical protein
MSLDETALKALRDLREVAATEPAIEKLHELVIEINRLLDVVENRLAELRDHGTPGN